MITETTEPSDVMVPPTPYPDQNSTNASDAFDSAAFTTTLHYVNIGLFICVFLVGLANVALVVLLSMGRVITDTVSRIIVMNLCVANGSLILSVPYLVVTLIGKQWHFGLLLCHAYWFLEQGNKFSSIIFLTYLCCDRYISVVLPHKCADLRKVKRTLKAVAVCWLCVIVFLLPKQVYVRIRVVTCTLDWPSSPESMNLQKVYSFGCFTFVYIIPVAVICFLYALMLRRLWSSSPTKKKTRQQLTQPRKRMLSDEANEAHGAMLPTDNIRNKNEKRRSRKYRKATIVIMLVCLTHVLLWSPFWIMHLILLMATNLPITPVLYLVMQIINLLPYINCAIFPYFYLVPKD